MTQRILIVDDEPHIVRLLKKHMEQFGYEVTTANNGAEAIHVLEENSFDLVIADIVMPECDGLEVVMFLEKQEHKTPIIAMSAPGRELFLDSAKGLGADCVLQKPVKLSTIMETSARLISDTRITSLNG